ncbi:MAG: glycosyltransferase family 2 protein [Balneolales bacterium]
MKVSIITVVFNNRHTIRHAIQSVLGQDHPDLEYIIIDGGSTDGTLEIIKTYGSKIDTVVSEPDNGIYDAMNKGIARATGDIVGILNSDDIYQDRKVLSRVDRIFTNENPDSLYGDLVYVEPDDVDKVVRYWQAGKYYKGIFLHGWMPPHPTFFVKKEVYDRLGDFRDDMGLVADYEIMLRFLHRSGISTWYIPEILVRMRNGGTSNASISNRIKVNLGNRKAWKSIGMRPNFYTLWMKPIRKIPQYLKRIELEKYQ